MKLFSKTPRSVNEIMSSFTTVIDELDNRIQYDESQIEEKRLQIEQAQEDIAKSESSKNDAISIRSRMKEMIGL